MYEALNAPFVTQTETRRTLCLISIPGPAFKDIELAFREFNASFSLASLPGNDKELNKETKKPVSWRNRIYALIIPGVMKEEVIERIIDSNCDSKGVLPRSYQLQDLSHGVPVVTKE